MKHDTVMKKKWLRHALWLTVLLVAPGAAGGAADFKTAELQRKAEEIASLRIAVSDKVDRAVGMRRQLSGLMQEYVSEINSERNRRRYKSYREAVGNPRVGYDLQLVQQLEAYTAMLDERISYFRKAAEVLEFYFRQVNDDLMMIRTLDDFAVDQLIARINGALDEYVPAVKQKTVRMGQLQFSGSEIIWQRIAAADREGYSRP